MGLHPDEARGVEDDERVVVDLEGGADGGARPRGRLRRHAVVDDAHRLRRADRDALVGGLLRHGDDGVGEPPFERRRDPDDAARLGVIGDDELGAGDDLPDRRVVEARRVVGVHDVGPKARHRRRDAEEALELVARGHVEVEALGAADVGERTAGQADNQGVVTEAPLGRREANDEVLHASALEARDGVGDAHRARNVSARRETLTRG